MCAIILGFAVICSTGKKVKSDNQWVNTGYMLSVAVSTKYITHAFVPVSNLISFDFQVKQAKHD